jgi:hypothetical protein
VGEARGVEGGLRAAATLMRLPELSYHFAHSVYERGYTAMSERYARITCWGKYLLRGSGPTLILQNVVPAIECITSRTGIRERRVRAKFETT